MPPNPKPPSQAISINTAVRQALLLAWRPGSNPERRYPSMFEPVHGAAFDIAGQGKANPLATVFAVGMLLEHLGEDDAARRVNAAALQVLNDRAVLTADLGGTASTGAVGDEVVRLLG